MTTAHPGPCFESCCPALPCFALLCLALPFARPRLGLACLPLFGPGEGELDLLCCVLLGWILTAECAVQQPERKAEKPQAAAAGDCDLHCDLRLTDCDAARTTKSSPAQCS